MSDMQGNPHYGFAMDQIDCAEDMTSQEQIQADATLALAFEQRTANLIAAFGQLIDGDSDTFLGERVDGLELAKQIKERLGLK